MLNQRRQKAFLGGKKPFGRLWEVVEELKQKKKAEAEAAGQEVASEEDLVGAATTAEEAAEVYIRHVARVPTPAVRGRACASAERVTEAVLQDVDVATADPVNPEKIQQALRAQMCAHRAMDAPKHFPSRSRPGALQRAQASSGSACQGSKVHESGFGFPQF